MTENDNWDAYYSKNYSHYEHIPKAHRDAMMSYFETLDTITQTPDDYDILFAVDYLLADHLDLEEDSTAIMLRDEADAEGLLPSDEMYNDPDMHRVAKELLLLFPLRSRDITSLVDLSYDSEAAAAWYYNTAVAILERTDETHSGCGDGVGLRCNHSAQCPRRVVAKLLQANQLDELEMSLGAEGQMSMIDIKTHIVTDLYKPISL
ncbi:MAG TPA: hypothetical protein VF281_03680 [Candidatus Saccharimonadales bacterium]